jgi:hypothetical protein
MVQTLIGTNDRLHCFKYSNQIKVLLGERTVVNMEDVLWISIKYWNYGTELISAGDQTGGKVWIEHALGLGEYCKGYEQIENVYQIDIDETNLSKTFISINEDYRSFSTILHLNLKTISKWTIFSEQLQESKNYMKSENKPKLKNQKELKAKEKSNPLKVEQSESLNLETKGLHGE